MRSIELNWIRRKIDKSIILPEFLYYPFTDRGACYYLPHQSCEIYDYEGKPYSLKNGAIVIGTGFKKINIASTIAHEWRHHWQYFNGKKYKEPVFKASDIVYGKSYNEGIYRYFSTSESELDALRCEAQYGEIYPEWLEVLHPLVSPFLKRKIITYGK